MGNATTDLDLANGLNETREFEFANEIKETSSPDPPWDILIVDDDLDVHRVTRIVLKNFMFENRGVHCESAYTAAEAKTILSEGAKYSLILLDVVMERDEAGLELVRCIRNELDDKRVQIVLRTGQPGIMCETDVILKYAINDYRTKTELTSRRLLTTVAASLRAYSLSQQLTELNTQLIHANKEIESQVRERTHELLEAKETAEYILRQRSEMLAHITHDLRSPLSGILGLSQILAMEVEEEEHEEILRVIGRSCEQLLELVNNVLDFSKIEAGAFSITNVCFDPREALQSVYRLMKPVAVDKGLSFTVDVADDVPSNLHGDPIRLKQILQNLVGNAIKFTKVGEVRIRAKVDKTDEHTTLSLHVTDTGVGIAPKQKKAIFERYRQIESAQSEKHPGSGLGLFITQNLVGMMGGHMNMHSEVGKGTTFAIRLPIEAQLPDADSDDMSNEHKNGGVYIRFIDTDMANALQRKLAVWGVKISDYAEEHPSLAPDTSRTVAVFDQAIFQGLLTDSMVHELNKFLGIIWVKTADLQDDHLDRITVPVKALSLPLRTLAIAEACDELLGSEHKKELSHNEHSTIWPSFNLKLIVIHEEPADLQLLLIFLQKLRCQVEIVKEPTELNKIAQPEQFHAIMMSSQTLKKRPQIHNLPVIVFAESDSIETNYSRYSPLVKGVLEEPCQPGKLIPFLENFSMTNRLAKTHTFSIH